MKQPLKKLMPKNRFARSVSILSGGTAAGQGIVVLSSPLLTRLYSPEDFGMLAVYSSLLGIIGVISSLRYQMAIPLPEKDEEASNIVVLSLLIVLAMSLFAAIIVTFWGKSIATLVNTPALAGYLWLFPLGLLAMGIYDVFNYWAIRTKSFTAIARTKLTQSASMVAIQLAGYALGPVTLLVGWIFGQAAGTTSLGMLAIRHRWAAFRAVRIRGVMQAAARYKRFPIFSTWSGAFNNAGVQLPPLLFAALFSVSIAGIYILAHRVLAMPMTLIGRAIADVFFSHAADARRENRLAPLVAGIHEKLAHIGMPPALILMLAGPELFTMVFGANWQQAGEFAQWMAPWIYLVFVTSPLSMLFSVLEKQAQGMIFQGLLLIVRIGSLLIGAFYSDILFAVALFSATSAMCYLGLLVWIVRASGNMLKVSWAPSLKALAWACLLVAPLAVFKVASDDSFFLLPALFISVMLIAGRYMILLKKAW